MRPPNPIHPGRMLREEFLAPAGVSQCAFAKRLGWTVARLNDSCDSPQTDPRAFRPPFN